jgi:hypothetical protein
VVGFLEGADEGGIGVAFPDEEAQGFLLFLAGSEEKEGSQKKSEPSSLPAN